MSRTKIYDYSLKKCIEDIGRNGDVVVIPVKKTDDDSIVVYNEEATMLFSTVARYVANYKNNPKYSLDRFELLVGMEPWPKFLIVAMEKITTGTDELEPVDGNLSVVLRTMKYIDKHSYLYHIDSSFFPCYDRQHVTNYLKRYLPEISVNLGTDINLYIEEK